MQFWTSTINCNDSIFTLKKQKKNREEREQAKYKKLEMCNYKRRQKKERQDLMRDMKTKQQRTGCRDKLRDTMILIISKNLNSGKIFKRIDYSQSFVAAWWHQSHRSESWAERRSSLELPTQPWTNWHCGEKACAMYYDSRTSQNHYFGTIGQKSCRQCSCSPTEEIKLF